MKTIDGLNFLDFLKHRIMVLDAQQDRLQHSGMGPAFARAVGWNILDSRRSVGMDAGAQAVYCYYA